MKTDMLCLRVRVLAWRKRGRPWLTERPAHAVDLDKGAGTKSREMPLPLHLPFHPSRLLCLLGEEDGKGGKKEEEEEEYGARRDQGPHLISTPKEVLRVSISRSLFRQPAAPSAVTYFLDNTETKG